MARDVLDVFPGYGIYQKDKFSLPLFEDEVLCNGQIYYLLPFGVSKRVSAATRTASSNGSASFRRDQNSALEVLPSRGNGVWRVKMAIDSKDLEEMLSPENAEALIEMMRSAAKSSSPTRRSFGWRRSSNAVISCGFKSTGWLMA